MKISNNTPVNNASATKKKAKASGASGFAGLLGDVGGAGESAATSQSANVAGPSAIDGMLALQEVSDEDIGQKKAVRQGNDMLDALEDLRLSILLGEVSPTQLERIQKRMEQQRGVVMNPELQNLINEIEVRAAVELAKLGR